MNYQAAKHLVDPPILRNHLHQPQTEQCLFIYKRIHEVTRSPNAFVKRKDKMPTFYGESFDLNDEEPLCNHRCIQAQ